MQPSESDKKRRTETRAKGYQEVNKLSAVLCEVAIIFAAIAFTTALFTFVNQKRKSHNVTVINSDSYFKHEKEIAKNASVPMWPLGVSEENASGNWSAWKFFTLPERTAGRQPLSPYRPLVKHNLTDEQLFDRALAMPKFEPKVPMIAFLFLTRGPLPLARLWADFFGGHELQYSIYIHADPQYIYGSDEIPEIFRNRTIPSKAVKWGDPSMVCAERRLLANALLNKRNMRFVLLSESCIPLFGFQFTYSYIMTSPHSFTLIARDPHEKETWGPHMLPEVKKSEWRKGDEWKEVERSLALLIIQDRTLFPKFETHCLPPRDCFYWGYIDERFVPTLLSMKAPERVANRSLTWSDWKRHQKWVHPYTYEESEATLEVLWKLRNVTKYTPFGLGEEERECLINGEGPFPCYLFARKFAPSTLKPLLDIAGRLGIRT